ncbi:uncharacterized protein IWZ02DRAFT_10229 [Phyllosticta citriasiana]|uniref:Uncharacterized protein n=1 Tax=Phyllosticta citriasiana TaxID=595635 RepID=A0ABR1KFH9_9PEZI
MSEEFDPTAAPRLRLHPRRTPRCTRAFLQYHPQSPCRETLTIWSVGFGCVCEIAVLFQNPGRLAAEADVAEIYLICTCPRLTPVSPWCDDPRCVSSVDADLLTLQMHGMSTSRQRSTGRNADSQCIRLSTERESDTESRCLVETDRQFGTQCWSKVDA